jgi:glycosyltransferase involved in cell wall biosynthesis
MKVSIVMITYNHERYIAEALASVLAQRVNFDYEIVVGEDCSTDGTRDILMDYYRKYPAQIVPLLRSQNLGASRNAVATLQACRGQYLAMLEGDDYWTCKDKLQKQVDFLDEHGDYAICCHRVNKVDEMSTGRTGISPTRSAGSYTIDDLLGANFIASCSIVCRWDSIGSLPPWLAEMKMVDWPVFILLARNGKIELMDEVMATYRVHSGGMWSTISAMSRSREIIRMLTAVDKHLDFHHTSAIRRTIAQCYFEMAVIARRDSKRAETGKWILDCLRSDRFRFPCSQRTFAGFMAYVLFGSRAASALRVAGLWLINLRSGRTKPCDKSY